MRECGDSWLSDWLQPQSTCCKVPICYLNKFTWKIYDGYFFVPPYFLEDIRWSQGLHCCFQVQTNTILEVILGKTKNFRAATRVLILTSCRIFTAILVMKNNLFLWKWDPHKCHYCFKALRRCLLSCPRSTLSSPWCVPFVLCLCSSLHHSVISVVNCSPFFLLFLRFAHSTFFSSLALPLSKLFHHLIFAFFEPITPSLHHFIFVLVQLQKWDLAVTNLLAKPPRAPRGCASSRRTCVIDWTWGKLCQAGHHYWISWLIINSPLPQVLRGDTSVMWRIFMTHGAPDCYAWCSLQDSFLFYVWALTSHG